MKQRILRRRCDGHKQHYHIGRKRRFSSIVKLRLPDREYVHDDDIGITYVHVPGKNSGGYDGNTVQLYDKEKRELVEMKGPWHVTASHMRSKGMDVYDESEPEYLIKKGVLKNKPSRDINFNGVAIKHFIRGESKTENPILAYDDGKPLHASDLGITTMENRHEARKKFPMALRARPIHRPELFKGEEWTKYGHGREPFPSEKKKITEGMKIFNKVKQ
jgi:hypothetical protein